MADINGDATGGAPALDFSPVVVDQRIVDPQQGAAKLQESAARAGVVMDGMQQAIKGVSEGQRLTPQFCEAARGVSVTDFSNGMIHYAGVSYGLVNGKTIASDQAGYANATNQIVGLTARLQEFRTSATNMCEAQDRADRTAGVQATRDEREARKEARRKDRAEERACRRSGRTDCGPSP